MNRGALGAAAGLAALCLLLTASTGAASPTSSGSGASAKLRGDLAALVSGRQTLDRRIPGLIVGYQPGEIPYFAVLSEPDDAAHEATITALGARVLRAYRSVNAFALASTPSVVQQVAALSWVKWMAPVEVVTALADHEVDQSKATTADVGAPEQWDRGLTGSGVRIAVLDTGLDPTHPDLDDLDFRNWSSLLNPPKVVESRNFVGGGCSPVGTTDGHGHGTHVSGIATGTGEGAPLDASDDGKYAGIAPGAELAVGKVLTDAGAGLNSDLVAAMEWAAMPADPSGCSVGANIVNMSIGSESRPTRLNSDSDVDFVSYALDRLAVKYGTLFVAAVGNSGPFIGSALEAPGSAAQALSVAAAAKDYDLNHDDTLSGDTCAGWKHPRSSSLSDNDCRAGVGDQPPSIDSFSSRGPSGDVWLRPDLAAPGYNIVSAQAASGTALAANDLDLGTRADPLYATASGTSMATPATAGSAALVLQAYRAAHGGSMPSGASGIAGLSAPTYALLRAALMNTAGPDLYEARWILTTDASTSLTCPPEIDPFSFLCPFASIIADGVRDGLGSLTLYEVRNGPADPYVGPLAEGAGKLQIGRAVAALRDGVVAYSAASGSGADAGTGHRDFQGSWQIGAISAGSTQTQRFVLHAAPAAGPVTATFSFDPGHPSDSSSAIPSSWLALPATASVPQGGDAVVSFTVTVPSSAPAGTYTGAVLVSLSNGQLLHIPVFASVALHDPNPAEDNAPGPQARISSARDVFGKDDTSWPSAAGTPGTGANADWLVYPVDLAGGLDSARFSVYDAAAGDETYDLYLYDEKYDLIATTHPFASPGVTDTTVNDARGPSPQASPQVLSLAAPAVGRYYLAVNRAKIGGTTTGDFGAFVLKLDEIRKADLSLTKTDSPDPVLAGQDLTYTLTAANAGPEAATDVVVTDTLPAGVTFVSAAAGCTGTTTVSCTLGTIDSGSSAAATIKVRPTSVGTLVNQATVASNETDPNPSNNTATATTIVNPAADLSVMQTDFPDPVHVGQSLTYTIKVANTGSTASGVTLTDNLPKNAGFGSAATSQGSCTAKPEKRLVTCALGNLAGGATATVTITVKPTSKGSITNTATVAAQSPVDPKTANNSSSESTTVKP